MRRAVMGLVLCSLGASACTESRSDLAPPGPKGAEHVLLIVSNEGSNDLSFIDTATRSVVSSLHVGQRPRGLRVSPDGKQLFVALSGSPRGGPNVDESRLPPPDRSQDGIGVVALEPGTVSGKLASGNDPESVDVSPDGRWLIVANEDSAQASLLEAASGALAARLDVGAEPEGVRFSPDGRFAYVTSEANDRIDVIDVAARTVHTRIPTGKRPRNVVFSPDGERAYVSCEFSSEVGVIDARKHRALTSLTITGAPRSLPMGLALDHGAHRLYVSLGRAGEVAVLDTRALREIGRVRDVGARPWGIALSPDGGTIYTANGPSGDVSVIDSRRLAVVARIPVGKLPWGLGTVQMQSLPGGKLAAQ